MPVEYVNYTIARVNGTFWAMVDGDFPIYALNQSDNSFNGGLSMLYPMPPNATGIHVFCNNQELSWTNYTEQYPGELHHTALGDWWMIYSYIGSVSNYFVLEVQYEHPLQIVNGSYLFLYNLNISGYLSSMSNNSTGYYTINFETNVTDIKAYTTETDTQWNPINCTFTKKGTNLAVSMIENSDYAEPLPGDLIVEFNGIGQDLAGTITAPSSSPMYTQTNPSTIMVVVGASAVVTVVVIVVFILVLPVVTFLWFRRRKKKIQQTQTTQGGAT
jgi:hypothetical protein